MTTTSKNKSNNNTVPVFSGHLYRKQLTVQLQCSLITYESKALLKGPIAASYQLKLAVVGLLASTLIARLQLAGVINKTLVNFASLHTQQTHIYTHGLVVKVLD